MGSFFVHESGFLFSHRTGGAGALREGLREGRWQGSMPGRNRLAVELGVNHKTVKAALVILEREGLLEARPRSETKGCQGCTCPSGDPAHHGSGV